MKNAAFFAIVLFAACTTSMEKTTTQIALPQYPFTDIVNQTDDYFGTIIPDKYRWLENDTSAQTAAWVKAQNAVTESYLSQIPFRKKLQDRFTSIWNYTKYSAPFKKGENYFFYKNDGLQNQSILYKQKGLNGEASVFIDPNTLSTDGTAALSGMSFNKEYTLVAYGVSQAGSDWKEMKVMNVATGEHLTDVINWTKFAGAAWYKDGFFYAGYDAPAKGTEFSKTSESPKIYYHKLGTSQKQDVLIYQNTDAPLQYYWPQIDDDEQYLLIGISEGTSGSAMLWKELASGVNGDGIMELFAGFDHNYSVVGNVGKNLLVQTDNGADNYQLILVDPAKPAKENWKVIIAEQPEVLEGVSQVNGKLFASYLKNASSRILQYSESGKLEKEIELPGIGTVAGFGGNREDTELFYTFDSYTSPSNIYKYTIATGKSELYRKSEFAVDMANYETKQVWYPSKDGTKIPMFITHKKGLKLDGNNPTYLYGYGGFNISLTPGFALSMVPFLEQGGVYVVANLRGGGEFGEAWHKAGMLEKKQNVFDDFIAAAEFLIKEKYTSTEKLAISGRSNGGLLVGACMTQRPDLYKVALPGVGVLDMLRYHKFTVGWGWAVEYGSSDKKDDFEYLIKYSPLHNVKAVEYPATLITTADHDDRVVPAHSFKFAAELQSKHLNQVNPVLIRIEENAGHGAGKPTSKTIEELTDIWSFVFHNLGMTY
jgi:prolyl oligopeptidase